MFPLNENHDLQNPLKIDNWYLDTSRQYWRALLNHKINHVYHHKSNNIKLNNTVTGASTLYTFDSSTRISRAF